ncbi:MAG TPA: alpha/beta fold hydrolase [Polyangiaceae bacterium]|nr:alpha/beta fold hydrolase [Polyangiaceae bacterium]
MNPFFFSRAQDSRRLYGASFGGKSKRAYLLCGGFAGEFEVFRSHLSHLARRLAASGAAVLRFDYLGYGDSDGEFVDASIDTMCEDTLAAIDVLKAKSGARRVGILGLRLGATVATLVAQGRDDIDRLVLWEPIVKPWDDLYAELRQTLSLQTVLFRDIRVTREQIVENVLAGRPSRVDGYDLNVIDDGFPLSAAFVESAKRVDLLERCGGVNARTLVMHVRKRPGPVPKALQQLADRLANGEVTVAIEPSLPWRHEDFYMTHSPKVFDATLAWLDETAEMRIGA